MAEGFFDPADMAVPQVRADRLCAAMVRIRPKTMLVLGIAESQAQADALARNEIHADGSEHWYRFFTPQDLDRANEPEFAMGMVRHEFARLVRAGSSFPATVPLDGGGTGFAINPDGHVLTNYHLVTGEVGYYRREEGAIDEEVLCRGLCADIAIRNKQGGWDWVAAREVWLVSNPPKARALWDDGQGRLHPREDTALLRIVPPPSAHLSLSPRIPALGEPVWMAGFPLRSARRGEALAAGGYTDADGSLRVSTGVVTALEAPDFFTTDLDGSMGNSGSPVFDAQGQVIGMFTRAAGNGPRNAFEFGHVQRVHVTTALATSGLGLLAVDGAGGAATRQYGYAEQ
ncbi:S1 family peptidase [Paucibacter sp. XJ19-41]|uniref:S1 family peptidase n=1 Tax=Paucibacter sp. XJ19-41 TaxID=2927824 RepID=UPI00234A4568|nr:serine protease [Paucibacter sp. XJ19-41]MDC6170270.1 serine protease [Paucibacter sp. XJ19-41]